MAGINTKLFKEFVGQLKILTVIFGIIIVILTVNNYFDESKDEEIFWWNAVACLIISVIFAGLALLGALEIEFFQKLDKIYHCLSAIVLIVTAGFFIYSVDYYHKNRFLIPWTINYEQRAIAGAFGLANGLVCGWIGWMLPF